jgi:hypothetical protein
MVIGGLLVAGVLGLALGWFVQLLWNATLVPLFSLPLITYWQAVGLFILGKLIFGGFGHGHPKPPFAHAHHWKHHPWAASDSECCEGERHGEFERFWKEEGQKAFEAYCERLRSSPRP